MKPKRSLKSSIVKRSIIIGGRKTSISLEQGFWETLKEIVKERQTTLQELITSIKAKRQNANLSSAIRLFILDHFAASKATNAKRMKEESPGVEGPGLASEDGEHGGRLPRRI